MRREYSQSGRDTDAEGNGMRCAIARDFEMRRVLRAGLIGLALVGTHATICERVQAQAARPAAEVAQSDADREARLHELKALYDKGLISRSVFLDEQRRILRNEAATPATGTAARAEQSSSAGGLRPGDHWDYVVVDSRKGFRAQRSFEIEQSSNFAIVERIRLENGKTLTAEHHKGPYLTMLGGMQFAPYYLALQSVAFQGTVDLTRVYGGDACETRVVAGADYAMPIECEIKAKVAGPDRVTVPAGTFEAVRVHVAIHSQRPLGRARQHIASGDFWVSTKAGRLIKSTVQYDASGPWTETMELVSTNVAGNQ
jgi:hypothetical protein